MNRISGVIALLGVIAFASTAAPEEVSSEGQTEPGAQAVTASPTPELENTANPGLLPALDLGLGIPKLSIRGFGNAQYEGSWFQPDTGPTDSENHFALGGVDLFLTSRVASDVTFLSEIVFEFGDGGANILDVERVFLRWDFRDWLNLGIGREHTPLGYWNQTYHHGTWLYTTTDRPLVLDFEDDGGILPVHFVGLEALGRFKTGVGVFSYATIVANGRGSITDHVQLVEDLTSHKAWNLLVRYEPNLVPGLGFGFSVYLDKIPENQSPSDGTLPHNSMREQIYGAHLFYIKNKAEFLSEFYSIMHEEMGTNSDYQNYGAYVLAAYTVLPRFKPYYRFDILRIDDQDPYFYLLAVDTIRHTVGIRYDFRTFVALKGEYQHFEFDNAKDDRAIAQVSFAF